MKYTLKIMYGNCLTWCRILSLVSFLLTAKLIMCSRILAINPTPIYSHQLPFRALMKALHDKGHNLTVVTTHPIKENKLNYTEIDISFSRDMWKSTYDYVTDTDMTATDLVHSYVRFGEEVCKAHMNSVEIQDFLKHGLKSYDLIIWEPLIFHCYTGIFHMLGSPPVIGMLPFNLFAASIDYTGNSYNPSFSPDMHLPFTDHMTFTERMINYYTIKAFNYVYTKYALPSQEEMLRHFFGLGPPPVYETERNLSLMLINNHWSTNYIKPYFPNVVELSNLHMETTSKPLLKQFSEFLDGASEGAIYFSLGSNLESSAMPEDKIRAFVQVFSQLRQRILWKWDKSILPGRPDNVMIAKWIPQTDVLAHPNVKLFISQGGLRSVTEAVYNAVPMIIIPFFGDQKHHVTKMVASKVAIRLDFTEINNVTLLETIQTILNNQRYYENMKMMSSWTKETAVKSKETAVWWVEYVLRHKGAPHLRSQLIGMHWNQYLLIDIIIVLFLVGFIFIYISLKLLKHCRREFQSKARK